ncbi:MAG TPA: hypothetical protein PKO33_00805 [Pyrinomonadaceae bacterium]|nr:hypothetical protein [Pyrinomonadaceae bacterium]
MKKCPECGSEKIVDKAKVLDQRGTGLRVSTDVFPDALVFKKRHHSDLIADVCGACGFTALYADEPDKLWAAYQRQRNKL